MKLSTKLSAFLWNAVQKIISFILLSPFFITSPAILSAQPGTLDPTFGTNGQVIFKSTNNRQFTEGMDLRADGKIVLLSTDLNSYYFIRLLSDGTLDSTFNDDGIKSLAEPEYGGYFSIAVDAANRMLLIGGKVTAQMEEKSYIYCFLSDGSKDLSFGTDGKAQIELYGTFDASILIQPDGKILVAGRSEDGSAIVERYNDDGTPDLSFNLTGTLTLNLVPSIFLRIAIQPDGKIILSGTTDHDLLVTRLLSDGTPDNGFGVNGNTIIDNGGDEVGQGTTVLLNGKIVVTGYQQQIQNSSWTCWRLNDDGTADNNFGASGMLTINTAYSGTEGWNAFSQSDNSFITAGISFNGFTYDPLLIKVSEAGAIDNSFGNNGATEKVFTIKAPDELQALLNSSGEILLGADKFDNGSINTALAEFTQDGIIDSGFGENGTQTISVPISGFFSGSFWNIGVVQLPDEKILNVCNDNAFGVSRLLSNGKIDSSYGKNGIWVPGLFGTGSLVMAVRDSIIFAVTSFYAPFFGYYFPDSFQMNFAVYKFRPDGVSDSSFGASGLALTVIADYNLGQCQSAAVQEDGKILICGVITQPVNPYHSDLYLIRLTAQGALDLSFGNQGIVTFDWGNYDDRPYLTCTYDGKIVLSSTSVENYVEEIHVVRLLEDGSLDVSFATNGNYIFSGLYSHGIQVYPDNKILIGGLEGSTMDFIRLDANGIIDSSGGVNWFSQFLGTEIGGGGCHFLIQPDNKILLCGTETVNYYGDIFAGRELASGAIDLLFATNGKIEIGELFVDDYGFGLTLQSDGKILICGSYQESFFTARLLNDIALSNEPPGTMDRLKIFPNPASDETTIMIPAGMNESSELTLTNQLSQIVLRKFISPSEKLVTLQINNLPAGAYQISLKTGNNFSSAIIVKN